MQHSEIYRSCGFHIEDNGLAIFDCFIPGKASRWSYWGRFFHLAEVDKINAPLTSLKEKIELMHIAIDRAYNDTPCYTGDIRDSYKRP
jgi:hypothetical protein